MDSIDHQTKGAGDRTNIKSLQTMKSLKSSGSWALYPVLGKSINPSQGGQSGPPLRLTRLAKILSFA